MNNKLNHLLGSVTVSLLLANPALAQQAVSGARPLMWGGAASELREGFESATTENRVFTVDWLTLGVRTLDAPHRYSVRTLAEEGGRDRVQGHVEPSSTVR